MRTGERRRRRRVYIDVLRYNNGGEWLNSVFQTGPGKNLTGFVHAEYHYTEEEVMKVHKSISLGE